MHCNSPDLLFQTHTYANGIPKKFVIKYGSNLSDLVFLQVPSGQAWEVELVRRTDGVWLRRGWPDFVKHYAIKHGHFLVFRYEGGSAFRVVIFDKSASEIKYPIITELPKREENEGDTLVEVFEDHFDRPLRIQSGASNIVCDVNAGLNSSCWKRERPFRGGEKSEALKRAASFQYPNPFFLTLMQPSLIRHSLHIPSYRSGGDIDLYVSNERFWLARYKFGIYGRKTQVKINGGWKLFVQDNNLKVGDVCVFELTRKVGQVSFRVVIFRANHDAIELGR
ncbi:hypothetical protein EUGRSUZ_H01962 [Eucalyptus grandis]|uniref:TF-B3 domain-containing protein n=2 Tax=Eucalyptus grandis TaxID=71139 RepID=A0A059AZI7_EUCGR|nr:hypothetical protein EUGRSUZ_H01962 [Eucalyptus grandis]